VSLRDKNSRSGGEEHLTVEREEYGAVAAEAAKVFRFGAKERSRGAREKAAAPRSYERRRAISAAPMELGNGLAIVTHGLRHGLLAAAALRLVLGLRREA
jgi:hypothetical protein